MSQAKKHFTNFVQNELSQNQEDEYKILLKILYENFDDIKDTEDLVKKIDGLVEVEDLDTDLGLETVELKEDTFCGKILSAKFSNFGVLRGSDEGIIPFDIEGSPAMLNIFYGPNGSGKSTIAEMLEYGMTGEIREDKERGRNSISDITEVAIENDSKAEVTPSLGYDRFFFEKNRIDDFGRLKKKEAGDRRNLLASLFGYGEFEDYCDRFGPRQATKMVQLGERYIAENTLESKEKEYNKILVEYVVEKSSYLMQLINLGLDSYAEDVIDTKRGQIQENTEVLKVQLKKLSGNTINFPKDTKQVLKGIRKEKDKISKIDTWISKNKPRIDDSLIKLYQYFRDNKDNFQNKDSCPLCTTSKGAWEKDPFVHYGTELKGIETYDKKIQERKTSTEKLSQLRINLTTDKDIIIEIQEDERIQAKVSFAVKGEGDKNIEDLFTKEVLEGVEKIEKEVNELNKNLNLGKEQRDEKSAEWNEKIKKEASTTKDLDNLISSHGALGKSKNHLREEYKKIVDLHARVEKEKEFLGRINNYKKAYEEFITKISEYKNEMINAETDAICEDVKEYYNILNQEDPEEMKIETIKILDSGKVDIKLFGSTEDQDPLDILSEGHLKCLGLSILCARAKKFGAPFLVFDDVINAIDTDHRSHIIDLINHDDFHNTQFIILTHDRFFDELLGWRYSQQDKIQRWNISFNKQGGVSWGIDIQRYPANFEQKIDYFISNRDYRSAVSHMRIYLEHMLCYRVEFKVETKVKKGSICKPSLDHVRQKVCKQWRDEDSLRGKDELMHMNKLLLLDKIKDENSNWKILNQENHLLDIESPYYLQTKDIKETELRDLYQLLKQLYQELT